MNTRVFASFAVLGLLISASGATSAAAPTFGAEAAGSAPSFAPARTYATARGPVSIAIGDLDDDGRPDLATANPSTDTTPGTVSVLLNRGHGTFGARRSYRTGGCSCAVAIDDLNGDRKPDLVTANPTGDTISVLLNHGDGSFQAKRDHATGDSPRSVAIGDLNGDGSPELATANFHSDTISVFANKGDGSFETKRDYRTGFLPGSVAIGDLTGDGKPELVSADSEGRAVSVLVNRGDGSFLARRGHAVARFPFWAGIADVNGDAKPDLVSASMFVQRSSSLTFSVLLSRGAGTFRARRDYRGGRYPNTSRFDANSVTVGDLTGDGKPELAIACCEKPAVSVLTNTGNGRFQPKIDYRSGRPSRAPVDRSVVLGDLAIAVSTGDLNGDRRLDLAVANLISGTASVLVNAPGRCTVQDARGMRLPAARQTIARANCRAGQVRRVYSNGWKRVERGLVISQRPQPGSVRPNGGRVALVVSRGPRP